LIEGHAFVLLYSITDKESFAQLANILKELKSVRKDGVGIILVGTKADLEEHRRVPSYEAQKFARSVGCPFIEVSAKKNELINDVSKHSFWSNSIAKVCPAMCLH
jgi:GTPase SAR1 family protein